MAIREHRIILEATALQMAFTFRCPSSVGGHDLGASCILMSIASRDTLFRGIDLHLPPQLRIYKIAQIRCVTGVFPKWKRYWLNSVNLINHCSMNWVQFKDPVSHMCLAGTVVASWSLMQEVTGSSPFTVTTNISVNSVKTFRENLIE